MRPFHTSDVMGNPRIVLADEHDSVRLETLTVADARRYFDLIEADRPHLEQFGDQTSAKYPDVASVWTSIARVNGYRMRFGIWDNEQMVGSNNITFATDGRAELGSWIGSEHTGHYYAQRGRRLLAQYAFESLGCIELTSNITIGNDASRKSVEASGFTLTHTHDTHWEYTLASPTTLRTAQ